MPLVFLLLLISIPAIEIYLFIAVGGAVGAGSTVILTLATAAIGLFLVRAQGLAVMRRAQASIDRGEMPVQEAIDGLALFVAGIMLIIPGFFTDTIGGLLLIPFVRKGLGIALMAKLLVVRSDQKRPDGTIDGEYEVVRKPRPDEPRLPDGS
ncbi:MAG: FxsA family protein [Alphaproteobacteria bacterium]